MTDHRPADVEFIDPDDLTAEEQQMLARLQHAPPEEFDAELRKHVAAPTESSQMVFRHPSIVVTTRDALERLQAAAQQRVQHARNREMRTLYAEQVKKIGRELKTVRGLVNLAVSEASKNTPRRRAEAMLGRLMYKELTAIRRDYEAGLPEAEVEARAKQMLARLKASGGKATRSPKT